MLIMHKAYLFFLSLFFFPSCFCITVDQPACFFTPPPRWDFADPKALAPRVKIAFVGKTKYALAPSINLAVEEVQVELPEYVKAVEALYKKARKTSWHHIGFIKTQAGPAHLMQIDTETKYGPLRKLQLIFIKENTAYVLTAAALKKEFSFHLHAFQKALRSFTCTYDLYAPLRQELQTDLEQLESALIKKWNSFPKENLSFEELFNKAEFQELYWLPLQRKVIEDCQTLGAYWQIIVLSSLREHLSNLTL